MLLQPLRLSHSVAVTLMAVHFMLTKERSRPETILIAMIRNIRTTKALGCALALVVMYPAAAFAHGRLKTSNPTSGTGERTAGAGAFVRDLINAFSPVALVTAGIAATTGVFAVWLHVGTIPNLWGTRYGITLLVTLAVLGIVALTGFYNWRFVQPRLSTPEATQQLRRSALVEVSVAVIVLLLTAVLVASPTSMDMTM